MRDHPWSPPSRWIPPSTKSRICDERLIGSEKCQIFLKLMIETLLNESWGIFFIRQLFSQHVIDFFLLYKTHLEKTTFSCIQLNFPSPSKCTNYELLHWHIHNIPHSLLYWILSPAPMYIIIWFSHIFLLGSSKKTWHKLYEKLITQL